MVYSTRRFVVCLSVCHFVLVFFSPFSIAITSLGEERANLSAFRTLVRFVLVWIWRVPLPLGVWDGLRFVIVALPGLFSYLFFIIIESVSVTFRTVVDTVEYSCSSSETMLKANTYDRLRNRKSMKMTIITIILFPLLSQMSVFRGRQ